MLLPEDTLYTLHPIISRCLWENQRILIFRVNPIGLIEWRKARLEILLASLYSKKRI
jgi:hypothetical protein